MTEPTLRSPNEFVAAATELQLDGREPETKEDWALVMNFVAHNVHEDIAESACLLMRTLFKMPLEDDEVAAIVEFQLRARRENATGAGQ